MSKTKKKQPKVKAKAKKAVAKKAEPLLRESYPEDNFKERSKKGAYGIQERRTPIHNLNKMLEEGRLQNFPCKEMTYLNKTRASFLIDAIIRGLPTPRIFVLEHKRTWYVIDGFSRIKVMSDFMRGKWYGGEEEFKLVKTEGFHKPYKNEGKTFAKMTQNQKEDFWNTGINVTVIEVNTPWAVWDVAQIIPRIFAMCNNHGSLLEHKVQDFLWQLQGEKR